MDGYCNITVANYVLSRLVRFVSRFTTHPCKSFVNRIHLVFHAYVETFDVMFFFSFTEFNRSSVLDDASLCQGSFGLGEVREGRPSLDMQRAAAWWCGEVRHCTAAARWRWEACTRKASSSDYGRV